MPRKARDERLDTRAARLRLPVRREPYFRTIQEGRAIGYRRLAGGKAGTWIARHFDRDRDPSRLYRSLGSADDYLDADGVETLTFAQAQAAAAAWFAELGRQHGRVAPPLTVEAALADYAADYAARGGKDVRGLKTAIDAHIVPRLGNKLVKDLAPGAIRSWFRALATAPARVRSKDGALATRALDASDVDATRARRATANRVLTVLKAALNLAYRDGKVPSDDAWRRVLPFRNADAPRIRYLTDAEAVRLVNAADPGFRPMVTAALLTGARYGELVRFRVTDFNPEAGTLHVRTSKSGRPRQIVLTSEGVDFFRQYCAGRKGTAVILTKPDGAQWGQSDQIRPIRAACEAANIAPAISFHILRHTHATRLIMAGVPLGVVAAQLGNSETICAKHYAHLSPGYVAESIRAAFGPLGVVAQTNVKPMMG
ncbi:site-specific integrase [Acidiphilium sp. AL]|uniref:tyrosine-type recombinase/integrase n=1 Tax=Acidiphilium sp. AL TaxID=2871704 RepID=UPI0021CAE68D|nr:site-specific integrase [Acidiphilium sp. AL]MCU4161761.1 site-specific integrase [Acidiphilium sp. AL]